ncbi:MAG: hypothetical protein ACXACR_17145, partial [Candidatus Hodarchaeales archaeon]
MLANCSDLRVAYYNGGSWTELDRMILYNNTQNTSVFFRLQNAISATNSDNNYALYYGIRSGSPGTPPQDNVFLEGDDFSSGNLNNYSGISYWSISTDITKLTTLGPIGAVSTSSNIALGSSGSSGDMPLNRSNLSTNNTRVLVLMKTTDVDVASGVGLRSTSGSDHFFLEHSSTNLRIVKDNGTDYSFVETGSGGFSTTQWYFYVFEIIGNTLRGKNWKADSPEPSDWNLTSIQAGLPLNGDLMFISRFGGASNSEKTQIGMWKVSAAVDSGPNITIDDEEREVIKITNISITNEYYHDSGGSGIYWDNNDDSEDNMTITVTAELNVSGTAYSGEVNVGYIGDTTAYGSTSSQSVSVDDGQVDTTITRTITVGSAVDSGWGTEIYLDPSLTLPVIGWDDEKPTLSDAMSAYQESGDVDEVFNNTNSNILYFSNSFDSSATVTFTATGSDAGGGSGVRGIDFGIFGADNPAEDTSSPYTGLYTLNTADNAGSITVTIYDNVGNSDTDSITCTEDVTSPSISITGESESSQYLYSGYGTGAQGVYGSGMGSTQAYNISGSASDVGSDLLSVTDNTSFGDNPSNTGTATNWNFEYQIDAADNNDITVTFTVTDNVGNTEIAFYTFFEDN